MLICEHLICPKMLFRLCMYRYWNVENVVQIRFVSKFCLHCYLWKKQNWVALWLFWFFGTRIYYIKEPSRTKGYCVCLVLHFHLVHSSLVKRLLLLHWHWFFVWVSPYISWLLHPWFYFILMIRSEICFRCYT